METEAKKTIAQMFSGNCKFIAGVTSIDILPDTSVAEVAFAGRSNVGKSTLLNAITSQANLARTSHTPGRTQQLNFFDVGGEVLRLVDLPGYGYAKASKKDIKAWNSLIRQYLKGRPNLRQVFILIDSRHGAKDVDIEVMKLLDEVAVAYQIILTKIDKVKKQELEKCVENIKSMLKKHPAAFPEPHCCSSHKKYGIDELRYKLYELAKK